MVSLCLPDLICLLGWLNLVRKIIFFWFSIIITVLTLSSSLSLTPLPVGNMHICTMICLDSSLGGMYTHATHDKPTLSCVCKMIVVMLAKWLFTQWLRSYSPTKVELKLFLSLIHAAAIIECEEIVSLASNLSPEWVSTHSAWLIFRFCAENKHLLWVDIRQ